MSGYYQPPRLDSGTAEQIATGVGAMIADLQDWHQHLRYRETGSCDDIATQAADEIADMIAAGRNAQRWLRGDFTPVSTKGPAPSLLRGEGEPGQEETV